MDRKIVINTGPIIAFTKMGALEIIGNLPYEFISTPQVYSEIQAGSAKHHSVVFPEWVRVIALKNPLSRQALANLDLGEASVIELALEQGITLVSIDELKGRRAAAASGLNIVGSLGLMGNAKKLDIVSAVRPLIEQAQESGIYYDRRLLEGFLKGLGE